MAMRVETAIKHALAVEEIRRTGMPVGHARARYRVGMTELARSVREAGLPARRRGRPRKEALREAVVALRGQGWTLQKIADAHGVTRQAVSDMLIKIRRGQ